MQLYFKMTLTNKKAPDYFNQGL